MQVGQATARYMRSTLLCMYYSYSKYYDTLLLFNRWLLTYTTRYVCSLFTLWDARNQPGIPQQDAHGIRHTAFGVRTARVGRVKKTGWMSCPSRPVATLGMLTQARHRKGMPHVIIALQTCRRCWCR